MKKQDTSDYILQTKCFELIKLCNIVETGYGIFFFKSHDIICGGADLSLSEIISLLEKIAESLNPTDISLLIENLRQSAAKKLPQ